MRPRLTVPIELVQKLLEYDPTSGVLMWRVAPRRGSVRAGDAAGCKTKAGYVFVGIGGKSVMAHRLAWLLFYGEWPGDYIDHINGDKADNRITNLRAVSNSQNMQNMHRPRVDNPLGLGVTRIGSSGYRADIWVAGKRKHLGVFKTVDAARAAYSTAKAREHIQPVAAGAGEGEGVRP